MCGQDYTDRSRGLSVGLVRSATPAVRCPACGRHVLLVGARACLCCVAAAPSLVPTVGRSAVVAWTPRRHCGRVSSILQQLVSSAAQTAHQEPTQRLHFAFYPRTPRSSLCVGLSRARPAPPAPPALPTTPKQPPHPQGLQPFRGLDGFRFGRPAGRMCSPASARRSYHSSIYPTASIA